MLGILPRDDVKLRGLTFHAGGYAKGDMCIETYINHMAEHSESAWTAGSLRAVYFQCLDASPLFTGSGFSFSGVTNPLNDIPVAHATVEELVTSREFVTHSQSLKDLGIYDARVLEFPQVPDVKSTAVMGEFNASYYDFLETGFFPMVHIK